MNTIFLIGMPCAGKTTYGKKLATKTAYRFCDLDAEIERIYQTNISKLFAEEGEKRFREIERDTLHTLADEKEIIVATGGGTPCFYNNIDFMKAHGTVIWLHTPKEKVVAGLLNDTERPLLQAILKGEKNTIEKEILISDFYDKLYHQRYNYYAQAHEIVINAID